MTWREFARRLFIAFLLCVCTPLSVLAVSLEELDPGREWRLKELHLEGNAVFSQGELRGVLLTTARPSYLVWKEFPLFDPVTFATDLQRLEHFYETRGYYQRAVTHTLDVDEPNALVTINIVVEEHTPVTVTEVTVTTSGDAPSGPPVELPLQLPLRAGDIFTETAYQEGEQILRDAWLKNGHAHVKARRKAVVDLANDHVKVEYTVEPGPPTVFGSTRVEGTTAVDPQLVLRELSYEAGERFSLQKIADSEQKVRDLSLFRVVHVAPEPGDDKPLVVPMVVHVEETPRRAVKLGLKYSTRDEFGAQVEWRDWNWCGDGRQLSLLLQLASVNRRLGVSFLQPHFLSPQTRALLNLRQEQSDEETFLLNATRFQSRLEHRFSPTLSGFLGYRAEFAKLNHIAPATMRALGEIIREGVVSGPSLGITWNTTEDPFNPQDGTVLSVLADQAGGIWGGDFHFYKITAEAKKYRSIGWQTIFATRLKIGWVEAFGNQTHIPLFERFYAGGERSVRGYGRRRLGPLSDANDPLGGLSLLEGSIELRRPLWRQLGGALFLDFGQVSRKTRDFVLDDLQFASGVGVWYPTAVGPLRLDIGFPFQAPRGDQAWQLHFSIGQFF
ncbi:MAG: BamA/TamA family outer membrane protein [Deltaproteobacteria bacterium]|nr:BamA/TamA family outer membrane protein [Deltaproteobacteria bacterium]